MTSDGVHDAVPHHDLSGLVSARRHDPLGLVDDITAAARADGTGYRDDATVAAVAAARSPRPGPARPA